MYKIHVEIGNPKYFCCICQNEKTNEYFLSKCNHKWCKDCHDKLKENTNLCPLCRKEFAITYKPEIDRTRKIAFIISLVIHSITCCLLLLLGRLYYLLLFDNDNDNLFENNIQIIPTTIFGTILLSMSIGSFLVLSYIVYKICKKRFNLT